MIEPTTQFASLKDEIRDRRRLTVFFSVLRIYYSIGIIVCAVAAGYIVAKKLNFHADRRDVVAFALGAVGLMTALLSHLTVKILNEREARRSQLNMDARAFMRILAQWANFEKLASVIMNVDMTARPTSARFLIHGLLDRGILSSEDAENLESALFVRNAVAHGSLSSISPSQAERAASQLDRIVTAIARIANVDRNSSQREPSLPLVG
jgi:uncharacterized protein YutE (UPF0331/DUF86 family)